MKSANGTRGRTRTDTVFPPGDFESPASTNFATRAGLAYAKASILPKARTSYNSRPFSFGQ